MNSNPASVDDRPAADTGPHPLARAALQTMGLPPPVARDATLRAASADHISNFNPHGGAHARYPPAIPLDLQRLYAKVLRDEASVPLAEEDLGHDHVMLTEGSVSALDLIMRAFAEPHQDSIVVTPPTFPFYAHAARANDVGIERVPLRGADLDQLDVDALVASAPKIIFLCRPNNPVGTALDLDVIAGAAGALPGGLIVVDEAYIEFAGVGSCTPLLRDHANLVITRTFSKAWGLAGARIGAAVGQPALLDTLRIIQLTYGVGSPAQALLGVALADAATLEANVAALVEQREDLRNQIAALPFVRRVYPSETNFLLVEVEEHEHALTALGSAGITVADTSRDVPDTLRISVGTSEANRQLVDALGRVHP
ncbi:MAG: aminotransferase class I/II-fold pyridoxal phosphate-dependent enzyme [Candidatus Microthrix sp.]|jgi:histidinol-phosphate aminotransferase|nr:aminotransferase class I/II-fold pyridoxal phosphate-dependent enzyme [Candidatus Microthrix sp.]